MRNNEKNIERKLPQLGINIKYGLYLAAFLGILGAIYACGATVSTVVGIYLGYRVLKLLWRIFGLLLSLFISVVSVVILTAIISLLIF